MQQKKPRNILSKRQWTRILPIDDPTTIGAMVRGSRIGSAQEIPYSPGMASFEPYTQSEMLAEYYPSGHKINSTIFYPNVERYVDEPMYDDSGVPILDEAGNQMMHSERYEEVIPRHAFAFQRIIAAAHIYHATANDVQHELAIDEPTEAQDALFNRICDSWHREKMEDMWYELFRGREVVAEAALACTLYTDPATGKRCKSFRVFSFEKHDILYPQFDVHGNLVLFGRLTRQYNDDGALVDTLEVWDELYVRTFMRSEETVESEHLFCNGTFSLDTSWSLISEDKHGFNFVPVAYTRNESGPGWWASQGNIEDFEFSFSQMAHNNKEYGNSILTLKSGSDTAPDITRGLDGTVKAIYMGKDDDAKFLEGQSASESYMRQLEKLEEMIYRDSNIVKSPTDLKSGDTPATAIKLLFTPNMMQCYSDLSELSPVLDQMWRIYAFAYGYCSDDGTLACMSLPVINWASPYVPISESAVTADVVALAGAKIISRETAAYRVSFYSRPGESKKVEQEAKREQDQDLQYEIKTMQANSRYGSISGGGGGTESHDKRDGDGDGIYDE